MTTTNSTAPSLDPGAAQGTALQDDTYNTEHATGQDNVQIMGLDVHNPVFAISATAIVVFVVYTLLFPAQAADQFGTLRPWLTENLDWVFIYSANFILVFVVLLALSPMGRIRLGGENTRPRYSFLSWVAMLFAAGIGIGIMFYAVLEPMNHFLTPPFGLEYQTDQEARELAMAATLYHWSFHPWAIYAVLGLGLAFFCYNKGLPLLIRSVFYPLLRERIWGWPGHIIDILAVIATMFGLATSLGYGAEQSAGGLNYMFNIPGGDSLNVVIVVAITCAALVSVLRGLDGGIKRLSEFNMLLALALALFVLAVGPTMDTLANTFHFSWAYITELPKLSGWAGREDGYFMHNWTTFYWSWWIAFSPFVGMFIARISTGRTIRQFVFGTLLAPSAIFAVWMTIFGNFAMDQYLLNGYTGVVDTVNNWQPEISLFAFLKELPLSNITSGIGIVLVLVFFTTSMDSGSLIMDTMTSGGKIDTPRPQRIFWCVFLGLLGIALLLGGGLASLQALALAAGFPFCLILVV
ncbi:MAG: BCCT family transporter, partial [Pseudomonadales bacterium]